jgi:prephenate dehydrogenase
MTFTQVTVIGTGLIGGSLALALRKYGFHGRILGCDRPDVLAAACRMKVIDAGEPDPAAAARGSDLIVLATPVGSILDSLEHGRIFPPEALITDVGSTKQLVVERACAAFGEQAPIRFLAGHPMAGKEHSGIQYADADLFAGAVWLVTPLPGQDVRAGAAGAFLDWVEKFGSRIICMDAERHDRLCAWISHLPQMLSTAFAATLESELGDDDDLKAMGGRALREMTRIASSPYSMWRDIAFTNTANIQDALLRLEQRLAHVRENLRTRELQAEFHRAQKFKRDLPS